VDALYKSTFTLLYSSVRFLWERMGMAFPYLFWPFVKKWLLNHRAAADNESKKLRYTDTADMRYGHMMSVFL